MWIELLFNFKHIISYNYACVMVGLSNKEYHKYHNPTQEILNGNIESVQETLICFSLGNLEFELIRFIVKKISINH